MNVRKNSMIINTPKTIKGAVNNAKSQGNQASTVKNSASGKIRPAGYEIARNSVTCKH